MNEFQKEYQKLYEQWEVGFITTKEFHKLTAQLQDDFPEEEEEWVDD